MSNAGEMAGNLHRGDRDHDDNVYRIEDGRDAILGRSTEMRALVYSLGWTAYMSTICVFLFTADSHFIIIRI